NDAPILPNVGMFASTDPLALDRACVDACLKQKPLPGSQLADNMAKHDFCDHHDHFKNSRPESEWRSCLEHAEKIGLGTSQYELIEMK
ncbi:MAG: 4Fe-4S ferredoxin, partial [Clostridia bacterium]|nr:4Fe-4S ferredoxin [Clostridia bacterium]